MVRELKQFVSRSPRTSPPRPAVDLMSGRPNIEIMRSIWRHAALTALVASACGGNDGPTDPGPIGVPIAGEPAGPYRFQPMSTPPAAIVFGDRFSDVTVIQVFDGAGRPAAGLRILLGNVSNPSCGLRLDSSFVRARGDGSVAISGVAPTGPCGGGAGSVSLRVAADTSVNTETTLSFKGGAVASVRLADGDSLLAFGESVDMRATLADRFGNETFTAAATPVQVTSSAPSVVAVEPIAGTPTSWRSTALAAGTAQLTLRIGSAAATINLRVLDSTSALFVPSLDGATLVPAGRTMIGVTASSSRRWSNGAWLPSVAIGTTPGRTLRTMVGASGQLAFWTRDATGIDVARTRDTARTWEVITLPSALGACVAAHPSRGTLVARYGSLVATDSSPPAVVLWSLGASPITLPPVPFTLPASPTLGPQTVLDGCSAAFDASGAPLVLFETRLYLVVEGATQRTQYLYRFAGGTWSAVSVNPTAQLNTDSYVELLSASDGSGARALLSYRYWATPRLLAFGPVGIGAVGATATTVDIPLTSDISGICGSRVYAWLIRCRAPTLEREGTTGWRAISGVRPRWYSTATTWGQVTAASDTDVWLGTVGGYVRVATP